MANGTFKNILTAAGIALGAAGIVFGAVEAGSNANHAVLATEIKALTSTVESIKVDMTHQFDNFKTDVTHQFDRIYSIIGKQ